MEQSMTSPSRAAPSKMQGVVTSTTNLQRNGAVGFIGWLGLFGFKMPLKYNRIAIG
jgi:hypothetical protein